MYWLGKYFSDFRLHCAALFEVFVTASFSLVPFLIAYLKVTTSISDGTQANIIEIMGRGQLFLVSYGLFGTVFWLAFVRNDKVRHNARVTLGVVVTLMMLPVLGMIGIDPSISKVVNPVVIKLSYWFYGALLILYYLLIFYTNIDPPEPNEVLDRDTKSMRELYEGMKNV